MTVYITSLYKNIFPLFYLTLARARFPLELEQLLDPHSTFTCVSPAEARQQHICTLITLLGFFYRLEQNIPEKEFRFIGKSFKQVER